MTASQTPAPGTEGEAVPGAGHTVIGLDLSLTSTGLVVVLPDGTTTLQRIQSNPVKEATIDDRGARLRWVRRQVLETVLDFDDLPHRALVVIEAPMYGKAAAGSAHDRAGLWWLTVSTLQDAGYPVVEVSPAARAKYATGKGNAGKDQVLAAVCRRYPHLDVTGNDVADALVLAAMGRRAVGHPIEATLPAANLTAMDAVKWPKVVP